MAEIEQGVFLVKQAELPEDALRDPMGKEWRCLNLVLAEPVHILGVYQADDFPIPGNGGEAWVDPSWPSLPSTYDASDGQEFQAHHSEHICNLLPLLSDEYLATRPWLLHALEAYACASDSGRSKVDRLSDFIGVLNVLYARGDSGLTDKLSNRVANVLAKDNSEYSTVTSRIKELYKSRSKKAHGELVGLEKKVMPSDLAELRQIVRRSILMAIQLSKGYQKQETWDRFCADLSNARNDTLLSQLERVRNGFADIW